MSNVFLVMIMTTEGYSKREDAEKIMTCIFLPWDVKATLKYDAKLKHKPLISHILSIIVEHYKDDTRIRKVIKEKVLGKNYADNKS